MGKTLYQRDIFFNQKWFEIKADGLWQKSKKLYQTNEYEVKYEDLGVREIKSSTGKKGWLIAMIISFAAAILVFIIERTGGEAEENAFIPYLIFSFVSGVVYMLSYKHVIYLTNPQVTKSVELLANKPSHDELTNFISELKAVRRKYMLNKYGQLNQLQNYDNQLGTLRWLSENDVLTVDEYGAKVKELNELFNQSRPIVGFQPNNN